MRAVDLFAGLGGATEGLERAGAQVLWAANHWPLAVQAHRANHPLTEHVCQDLQQFDFAQLPDHDLLWASPACQGHSRARGKERARHDISRSTAWAVVTAANVKRPPVVVVENVEDFARWNQFPAWCLAMKCAGYTLSKHVIDASLLGVPQARVRLYIVCTLSDHPLRLRLPRRRIVGARRFIDLAAGRWSRVERPGRAAATLRRVRAGRRRFGAAPFLISYYGTSKGGHCLDLPIGTLTTRARYAIVDGDRMRMVSPDEAKQLMSFAVDYQVPGTIAQQHHLIGNAVCPTVACDIARAVQRAA